MRSIQWFFLALVALVLQACASVPELPPTRLEAGERVGFLVEGGSPPMHMHIGTTVFNNFDKTYPYDWKLQAETARIVERSIVQGGFKAVDLAAAGWRAGDLEGLVLTDNGWKFAPNKADTIKRLREQLGLKAVIVLKEGRVLVDRECGMGPCTDRIMTRSGLYTRYFFGFNITKAIAAYRWNVYTLDAASDRALAVPLSNYFFHSGLSLRDFPQPVVFDNMTEAELEPVRRSVLAFISSASDAAIRGLAGR